MPSRQQQRLYRLLRLAADLPEVEVTGEQHRAFRVRGKNFAYYLNDHHGDGIVSLCCKATLEDQSMLVDADPGNFYVPAYVGAKGWVAVGLDRPRIDWDAVTELLFNAYRAQAPRRRGALLPSRDLVAVGALLSACTCWGGAPGNDRR